MPPSASRSALPGEQQHKLKPGPKRLGISSDLFETHLCTYEPGGVEHRLLGLAVFCWLGADLLNYLMKERSKGLRNDVDPPSAGGSEGLP